MRWLNRVIARLRTTLTQPLGNHAQLTPTAGPALQEPIIQAGNKRSAQDTNPHHQSQSLAQPRSQKKPKAAKSTTAVSKGISKKLKPVQTDKSHKASGSSTPTRASKTRQPALQASTTKQKAVASTTQAKKLTRSKTPAQTRTVSQSKARGS